MSQRKPKLGQNFLVDVEARHRIADALGLDLASRSVLEVGPGHGAITDVLAARCHHLTAIELDPALAAELRFRYRGQPNVEVLEADIRHTDLRSLSHENEKLLVVGNLPYYITSEILLHLFSSADIVSRAVLMMQREVAQRISAPPGSRDYGSLSALTQMYARVDDLFTLPPSSFDPPPDVYSTVVRLHFEPRFEELGVDATGFNTFVRKAFAQKRKTLRNSLLAGGYSLNNLSISWPGSLPGGVRAEQVALEDMAALYLSLRREEESLS